MANDAELLARLENIDAKLTEAGDEIPRLIQELRDEIAAGGASTPAIDAKLNVIEGKVTALANVDTRSDQPA